MQLKQTVKANTWQTWMSQWAELTHSGMPVLDALELSAELQEHNRQGQLLRLKLQRCIAFLQSGQGLQTAFRASCGALPLPLEVALMCAQANGDLATALQEQLQRWKATSEASRELGKSLIYPAVVLLLAIACWIFLHQVTSPHIQASTKLASAGFLSANTLLVFGIVLLAACTAIKFLGKKQKKNQYVMPDKAWTTSNFYHVIACELHAGIDLMQCLRHRSMPSQSGLFRSGSRTVDALNQITAQIRLNVCEGMALSHAIQKAGAPEFLVRQSQLAEQTGNLSYCFFLAAKVYEMQARNSQQKLQHVLPPVALAVAALTLAMAYQFTLAPLYNNLTGLS